MAFSSPSLQPNPNPPFLFLPKTLIQSPFKLPFSLPRVQSIQFTSERSNTSHDDKEKPNTKTKRRRKPRPSFLEETMERWSVKIPSQREAFPWENKNSESKSTKKLYNFQNSEFEGEGNNGRLDLIVEKMNVDLESVKCDTLNDLSGGNSDFGVKNVDVNLGNPLISAPWIQNEKLPSTQFDSSENNDYLKQGFEIDGKDEVIGEEELVEEEIYEGTNFNGGAKLMSNFDSSETNDRLKQNFGFDGNDEVIGEEELVEEEIYQGPNFNGTKSTDNFDSRENNDCLKQNFEFDRNDEVIGEEDLVEGEIYEGPNFKGAKLTNDFDPFNHDEALEMPDKLKHSIDSRSTNIINGSSIGGKSKERTPDKTQVDFNTHNANFFTDSSFSSENEFNSNPQFEDTQTHELYKNTHKPTTNFDKPTKSNDQKRPNRSIPTHFQNPNPNPKTLNPIIPNLTTGPITLPWLRSKQEYPFQKRTNTCPITLPWQSSKEEDSFQPKRTNTELAERTIPEPELKRLRDAALRLKERLKVGPAGVTQSLVEIIHEKWKQEESVKLRFEGPPSLNMKRTHQILEGRAGGIVIWRSGRTIVLFRGMTYTLPCVKSYKTQESESPSQIQESESPSQIQEPESRSQIPEPKSSFIDNLLDGLGPRYRDWNGRDPVPVDADLLPGLVPGYKPPYRILPFRTRRTLRDHQMTKLRRLAREMSPHFALGRNREHQGLAAAIVKLWEKSAVAKIAIKRGVHNTSNERMAEEIKKLTGGTLLSRNKEYIVLYRGNDFLTPSLRNVLLEKQQEAASKLEEEESARLKASEYSSLNYGKINNVRYVAGTLAETKEAKLKWRNQLSEEEREEIRRDLALSKHASLVRFLERKLHFANVKIEKAEKALAKVQEHLIPAELPTDLETLTDEERSKFRTIGLKMKAFGYLGRRGVFDGTVQNMHLNWKNKELVKVVVKRKSFAQVKHIAINLEAESGGVLVSVDKTTKGYAIVLYRGKNYMRPSILRPKNLLSKRQALSRSIELQRREALMHYMEHIQKKIETLKLQLEEMKVEKGVKNGERILQENDTCSDDEIEEEGDEAYLNTYTSDTDENEEENE